MWLYIITLPLNKRAAIGDGEVCHTAWSTPYIGQNASSLRDRPRGKPTPFPFEKRQAKHMASVATVTLKKSFDCWSLPLTCFASESSFCFLGGGGPPAEVEAVASGQISA